MKLVIQFNDELLRQYESRGASPFFTIYWEHNGASYPSEGWMDFGAIIIGWWIVTVLKLLAGDRQQKLSFMDGPYSIMISQSEKGDVVTCRAEGSDLIWYVPIQEIARELTKVANLVLRHLKNLEVGTREYKSLEKGFVELSKKISSKNN